MLWREGDLTTPGGTYVLRFHVRSALEVAFGRFRAGRPVAVPAGPGLYIGSAMGQRGASTLANRLLRHATRTDGSVHPVHAELVAAYALPATPRPKRLGWHIDYLLDRPEVQLVAVLACHGASALEYTWADALNASPHAIVLAPGLGATDHRQASHILGWRADDAAWRALLPPALP
jgi:Uri superfamily endonuclease